MKLNIFSKAISIFIFLTTVLIISTAAQSDARMSVTVADANGAVVAGARVTVTNEETGESRTVAVKNDGTFTILALKPTKYTIKATADNFEVTTKSGINLLVGQALALDLTLSAKGVAIQIDVVSGVDNIVNTASASMSANVNPREVEGLPINGRQL